jgi:hypothetical protein
MTKKVGSGTNWILAHLRMQRQNNPLWYQTMSLVIQRTVIEKIRKRVVRGMTSSVRPISSRSKCMFDRGRVSSKKIARQQQQSFLS